MIWSGAEGRTFLRPSSLKARRSGATPAGAPRLIQGYFSIGGLSLIFFGGGKSMTILELKVPADTTGLLPIKRATNTLRNVLTTSRAANAADVNRLTTS